MKKSHKDTNFTGVSLDAFNLYMLEMKHLSRLSPDEEAHLLDHVVRGNRAHREGSVNHLVLTDALHARNVLVEEYQRLVLSLARRYHRQCKRLELLDLIQEGNIGVIEALNRYDGASPKGGTFKTHAGCLDCWRDS